MVALQPRFLTLLGLCAIASTSAMSVRSPYDVNADDLHAGIHVERSDPDFHAGIHVERSEPDFHAGVHVERSAPAHLPATAPRVPRNAPEVPKALPSPPPKFIKRVGPPPGVSLPSKIKDKRSDTPTPALPVKLPNTGKRGDTPAPPAAPSLPVNLPIPGKDKRDPPAPPAAPSLPVNLPIPGKNKRDTPAPAAPSLPVKLPLPARDVTDPAVVTSKVPVAVNASKRENTPEPLEHPAVVRPYFARTVMSTVTDPLLTATDATADQTDGDEDTGNKDTTVNTPTVLRMLDTNPDPLVQTHEGSSRDGYKSNDLAVAGTEPDSDHQLLHDNNQVHPNGEDEEDQDVAGGVVHSHKQKDRRAMVPDGAEQPKPEHTVSDNVVQTPAGETVHTHKETDSQRREHHTGHWNDHNHEHAHGHYHIHEHSHSH